MSNGVWVTRPSDVRDMTGYTEGTLQVTGFSHRDAAGIKWQVHCNKCGRNTIETHRRILDGHLGKGCLYDDCRLNRLKPTRVTAHEQWLDCPDPVAAKPEPVKAEPVQRIERVSTDYLRYVAVCQKTGQRDVRTWSEFQNFGDFLHKNVMAQVSAIEERDGS